MWDNNKLYCHGRIQNNLHALGRTLCAKLAFWAYMAYIDACCGSLDITMFTPPWFTHCIPAFIAHLFYCNFLNSASFNVAYGRQSRNKNVAGWPAQNHKHSIADVWHCPQTVPDTLTRYRPINSKCFGGCGGCSPENNVCSLVRICENKLALIHTASFVLKITSIS